MNGHEFCSKSSSYELDSQIPELGERKRKKQKYREKQSKWMREEAEK